MDHVDRNEWLPESIELMENIIRESKSMRFVIEQENTHTNHAFGKLTAFNQYEMGINVQEILLSMNYCRSAPNFRRDITWLINKRIDSIRLSNDSHDFNEKLTIERYFIEKLYGKKTPTSRIVSASSSNNSSRNCKSSDDGRFYGTVSSDVLPKPEPVPIAQAPMAIVKDLVIDDKPKTMNNSAPHEIMASKNDQANRIEPPKVELPASSSVVPVSKALAMSRIRLAIKKSNAMYKDMSSTDKRNKKDVVPLSTIEDKHQADVIVTVQPANNTELLREPKQIVSANSVKEEPPPKIVELVEDSIHARKEFGEITVNQHKGLETLKNTHIGSQYPQKPHGNPTIHKWLDSSIRENNTTTTSRVDASPTSFKSESSPSTSKASEADNEFSIADKLMPTQSNNNFIKEIVRLPPVNHGSRSLHVPFTSAIDPTNFYEREIKKLVLVHTMNGRSPKSTTDMAGANFSVGMYKALDRAFKTPVSHPYRIQGYAWPHINRRNSIFLINPDKSGKTMSYLPPLMDLTIKNRDDGLTPSGMGPVAIILVPSAKELERVYDLCHNINRLLPNRLTIVKSYGCHGHEELLAQLYNGMDILLVTPGALMRALDNDIGFINRRCQHVVIDNVNAMQHLAKELHYVLRKCLRRNMDIDTDHYEQQVIVTSTIWSKQLTRWIPVCANPLLCIGSYIEAACYGEHTFKLVFIEDDDKLDMIVRSFDNDRSYLHEHTVIVCATDDEVRKTVEHLRAALIVSVGCFSSAESHSEINFVNNWNFSESANLEVIVCTDSILYELHLDRVKRMIHYSLPAKWSMFAKRFSAFFDSIPNILVGEKRTKTSSLIMVDKTNNEQLPHLIDFFKSHGFEKIVPAEVRQVADNQRRLNEIKKMKMGIKYCQCFLDFGQCLVRIGCENRHIFTSDEKYNQKFTIMNFVSNFFYF